MATSPPLQNGPEIERRRIEAGLTRPQLAHLAAVHRTYIRLIEREERNAQPPVIRAIADALRCDIRHILARQQEPAPARSMTSRNR